MPIAIALIGTVALISVFSYVLLSADAVTTYKSDGSENITIDIQPELAIASENVETLNSEVIVDENEVIEIQTQAESESKTEPETILEPEQVVVTENVQKQDSMMIFADGVYSTSVLYPIPYGYFEPMDVSLTLEDERITGAEIAFNRVNPTSESYQELFLKYYKDQIIGERIEDVNFSRIGGASLTNVGFDNAVSKIKREARGMEPESMMNGMLRL